MGLLSDLGPVLSFEEAVLVQPKVKVVGILQFIHILKKYSGWKKPLEISEIKWGEEI
jgi:hypothetical protein